MPKLLAVFSILLIITFALPSLASQTDVSGHWQLTMQTRRGEISWSVTFVQDGQSLTVTMVGPRGNETTGTGTIKDSQIEWTITRSTPRGEMTMTYKGEVEGETMSGEVQFGNFGSREWKATKKQG
ncbi:MAG: hypothetical protein ACE5GI_01725 [Candidatus Aminicenantales bacterium]